MAAISMMALVSCHSHDNDYEQFVGTWGLLKLSYYNIDYAGNPIASSMITYNYVPGDTIDGIDLVFRDDQTGLMIDRSRDTVFIEIEEDVFDTILCPDTVLIDRFKYSYDDRTKLLYLNMDYIHTFSMDVVELNDSYFTYTNQYKKDVVEKATMKRLSDKPSAKRSNEKSEKAPRRLGSFMAR